MNLFKARSGRSRLPQTLPPQRRPVCPSCRAPIHGAPRNGDLCDRCGNRYYLRRKSGSPTLYLLSAAQAAAFDQSQPVATRRTDPARAGSSRTGAATERTAAGEPSQRRAPLFAPVRSESDRRRFNWVWVHGTAEGHWRQLKRSLTLHARDGNWLLYRNARFEMAEIRRKQDRLHEAYDLYLEVWYLDLNGPHDCWGVSGVRRLYEEAPFQPVHGLTTPLVARWVNRIAQRQHYDLMLVERNFIEIATRLYQSMSLPVTPREAWRQVQRDLEL
jgi:hypothetical protein